MMEQKDKITMLEKNLERQIYSINAAEARISSIVALDVAMLGVLAALAAKQKIWLWYSMVVPLFAVLLLVIGLIMLLIGKFPRTKSPTDSCLYFGGISNYSLEIYTNKIARFTEDNYLQDLITQAHRNAQICNAKFLCIRWSMAFLFSDILFWFFSVWILFAGVK